MPSGSPETCAGLGIKNVCDDFLIAHFFCHPCRSSVKKAASIVGAIRTQAVDLQGQAIIQIPADRPPGDGHPHKLPVMPAAQGIFVTTRRLVVPVVLSDKGICHGQGYRF